ncbi:hypothetical protein ACUTFY_14515, partial [Burkholderia pseudomallei]
RGALASRRALLDARRRDPSFNGFASPRPAYITVDGSRWFTQPAKSTGDPFWPTEHRRCCGRDANRMNIASIESSRMAPSRAKRARRRRRRDCAGFL